MQTKSGADLCTGGRNLPQILGRLFRGRNDMPQIQVRLYPCTSFLFSLYLGALRFRILLIVLDAAHLLTAKGVGGGQADIVGMMISVAVLNHLFD